MDHPHKDQGVFLVKMPFFYFRKVIDFVLRYDIINYQVVYYTRENVMVKKICMMVLFLLFLVGCTTPVEYTVTFHTNGGNTIADVTLTSGIGNYTIPTPVREGYTFVGWYTNIQLTIPLVESEYGQSDMELYAKWQINIYTITFNSNGGSNVASIVAAYESPLVKPFDPTKEGMAFGGWFVDTNFQFEYTYWVMPAANFTLHAKWISNSTNISFETDGGTPITTLSHNLSDELVIPTPTRQGYIFTGWYIDESCTTLFHAEEISMEDVTLYAKLKLNSTNISFITNEGEVIQSLTPIVTD